MSNPFFLPPTSGLHTEGAALEDVLFMRDEMANLAWAIERVIESSLEQPVPRADPEADTDDAVTAEARASAGVLPRYLLSSRVPGYWDSAIADPDADGGPQRHFAATPGRCSCGLQLAETPPCA
jgi:hypothetical protein